MQSCLPLPKVQKVAMSARGTVGLQNISALLVSLGYRDMCLPCVRYSSEQQFIHINSPKRMLPPPSPHRWRFPRLSNSRSSPGYRPSPSSMYLHLQLPKIGTEGAQELVPCSHRSPRAQPTLLTQLGKTKELILILRGVVHV